MRGREGWVQGKKIKFTYLSEHNFMCSKNLPSIDTGKSNDLEGSKTPKNGLKKLFRENKESEP